MTFFLWPLLRLAFFLCADLAAFAGFRLIVTTALLFARLVFFTGCSPWPWAKSRIEFGPILKHSRNFFAARPVAASDWKQTGEERLGYFSDTRTVCGISGIGCWVVLEK